MKFLIIHNQYSRRGGEEAVVELQSRLLSRHGHDVVMYSRVHGEVGRFRSFFSAIRNGRVVSEIRRVIEREKPDVAIVHNLFPVISAAILPVLSGAGVRVIMTLHNYRLVCPNGLFYTHGEVCERCGTSALGMMNCALRRCEGSLAGSVAWTVRSLCARRYFRAVDRFMALSGFQVDKITKYSTLERSRFEIIPNCVDVATMPDSVCERGEFVGFVGRLSREKGVGLLLEVARLLPEVRFRVAGERAGNVAMEYLPENVELVGFLSREELADFYSAARYVILTSSCYETFPLTVLEAMYYRSTVVVPSWAALPEIVGDSGVLYEPNNAQALAAAIKSGADLGQAARRRVMDNYSSEQYYNRIMRCM